MDELGAQIARELSESSRPLTSLEIAETLEVDVEAIDEAIWSDTDRFVWQPGHRWALSKKKRRGDSSEVPRGHGDSRAGPLSPKAPVELRAFTLASGVDVVVRRRPLDTDALFTVKTVGKHIELILNSAHDVFRVLPFPFVEGQEDADFRGLAELLIEAWAVYEDGVAGTTRKTDVEESRLIWGRKMGDLVHGRDVGSR